MHQQPANQLRLGSNGRGLPKGHGANSLCVVAAFLLILLCASWLRASDHADPIDPFNKERLEGGITDLFFFPTDENGNVVAAFQRTDQIRLDQPDVGIRPPLSLEQHSQIRNLVVILCVRRQLTQTGSLLLEPYTYRVHMDLTSTVSFEDTQEDIDQERVRAQHGSGYQNQASAQGAPPKRPTGQEARARYGGSILRPEGIEESVTIELRLKNDATLNGMPTFVGLKNTQDVEIWTGITDDPFIFPAFFGTNVVAMVMRIPITAFPEGQMDWLLWATSNKDDEQIDHVGRSLRTQNPRFELLNTLHPSMHVDAIGEEHEDPNLIRDLALRFDLSSLFAYRAWDHVPDVMIYTRRFPVGFPNGRLLTDDVAALLAQHGDTLLLELSHHIGGWPRQTINDKPFKAQFPYLADPHHDRPPPVPPGLTVKNKAMIWIIVVVAVVIGLLALLQIIHFTLLFVGKKVRRRLL